VQIYNLVKGDAELVGEVERPKAFKCGTFGHSALAERHLATGDFAGEMAIWDLERLTTPTFVVPQAHSTIINCIDGIGGLKGVGAPEIATGGRDGCVHVWDPRQRDRPVASMEPEEGAPARDCWSVSFGDAHSADDRVVVAGYDNGDVKMLDLVAGKVRWETNVSNGVCGVEFDRKDIAINKLVISTLESRFRLYDMRTFHPVHGYSFLSQAAHESTVWAARHLPQNRDVFMTTGGNGSLELWKYSYPTQRKIKEKDGHDKGVLGAVQLLQKKTFSTQPVASFDWNADKEGLAVMGLLDQTVRVIICTKLNLL
jgi:WD40 repeat protein